MGELCVSSWSSYGLKRVITWQLFLCFYVFKILYLYVHENCQHVQGWNTTTTTSFPYAVFFYLFLLILLCLPNVSKKSYHVTVSDKLSAKHKRGLVSVVWDNVVSAHGAATALNWEYLGNYFCVSLYYYYYYYVLLMFQKHPIMEQYQINFLHKTKEDW